MPDSMPEEWRDVVGYEGLYRISSLGRVWSNHRGGRLLKLQPIGPRRYLHLVLYANGRHQNQYAHALVAAAFIGERPAGYEILHGDGDTANNSVGNLRYGTSSENKLDVVRHGRHNLAKRTHCSNGHEYTAENTIIQFRKGKWVVRRCRTCRGVKDLSRPGAGLRTRCPRGHEYTPENTRVYRGSRNCRACDKIRSAERRQGAKGAI